MKNYIILVLMGVLSSCANVKDVPYFQNADMYEGTLSMPPYDLTIKPKDQLTIFVFCGENPEAVAAFNVRDQNSIDPTKEVQRVRGGRPVYHYMVENDGTINYPIIGKIRLQGLTIQQANDTIKALIRPYLQEGINYVVNTIIDNYDITVMGEVKRPNTFNVTNNKVSVLEALAMAGDMTIYGKRDNVKLLREVGNGDYEIHELDLRDAGLLNSPYYYMQQRDILYVEPNEVMAQNAKLGRTRQLWIRGASITISLGSLLYRVLR